MFLKEIQDQNFNLIEQFGQIELQIQILELQKTQLKQILLNLKNITNYNNLLY